MWLGRHFSSDTKDVADKYWDLHSPQLAPHSWDQISSHLLVHTKHPAKPRVTLPNNVA